MSLKTGWRSLVGSKRKSSNTSTVNSPSNISSPSLDSSSSSIGNGNGNGIGNNSGAAGFGRSNSNASQNTAGGPSNSPPTQHLERGGGGAGQFQGLLGASPPMNQQPPHSAGPSQHGYPRSALSPSPYDFNGSNGALLGRTPNGYNAPPTPFSPGQIPPPQQQHNYPPQYMSQQQSTSPYPNSAQPQSAYPYAVSALPHSAQQRLPDPEDNHKSRAQLIVGIDFVSVKSNVGLLLEETDNVFD